MTDRFSISRIEAFSDGVFSIAATLLVLEIAVPESGFDDLWEAIGDQWPSYLAYTTSFFTIGALWTAHHGLFRRLESVDARMLHLNLLLLWVVAFLPFPTKLAAEALRHETQDPERAAVLFYGGVLLVISIVMTAMTLYASRRRELLREGVAPDELRELSRHIRPTAPFYGLILLLALVAPRAAVWLFLGLALASVIAPIRSGGRRRSET
jgi:uncharacterized membrane protein